MTGLIHATLIGGQLDGQRYQVPADTQEIRLARDPADFSKGSHVYRQTTGERFLFYRFSGESVKDYIEISNAI